MGYEHRTLLVRYDDASRLARCRVDPESVGKDWSSHNETLITLLADTGLRASELVALDWDHVDLDTDPVELYLPDGEEHGKRFTRGRVLLRHRS